MAWNAKNELICEGIQPVKRGAYGSVDGIRQASTNRKAASKTVIAAAEANNHLSDSELKAALAAIPTPGAPSPAPAAVERLIGQEKAKALAAHPAMQIKHRVPLARKWVILMLSWQGWSNAQIARTVRTSDNTVRRYAKEAAE